MHLMSQLLPDNNYIFTMYLYTFPVCIIFTYISCIWTWSPDLGRQSDLIYLCLQNARTRSIRCVRQSRDNNYNSYNNYYIIRSQLAHTSDHVWRQWSDFLVVCAPTLHHFYCTWWCLPLQNLAQFEHQKRARFHQPYHQRHMVLFSIKLPRSDILQGMSHITAESAHQG